MLLLFTYIANAQVDSTFPPSWDPGKKLGYCSNCYKLAWSKTTSTSDSSEWLHVFTLTVSRDSNNNKIYIISSRYRKHDSISNWHYTSIHYGPSETSCGYRDVHIESFDHPPGPEELSSLFGRWSFALTNESQHDFIVGTDHNAWKNILGYLPSQELKIKMGLIKNE